MPKLHEGIVKASKEEQASSATNLVNLRIFGQSEEIKGRGSSMSNIQE